MQSFVRPERLELPRLKPSFVITMQPPHARASKWYARFGHGDSHRGIELGDGKLGCLDHLRLVVQEDEKDKPRMLVDEKSRVAVLADDRRGEWPFEIHMQVPRLSGRCIERSRVAGAANLGTFSAYHLEAFGTDWRSL